MGPFITSPDRAVADLPTGDEIKKSWNEVNSKLLAGFESLSAGGVASEAHVCV